VYWESIQEVRSAQVTATGVGVGVGLGTGVGDGVGEGVGAGVGDGVGLGVGLGGAGDGVGDGVGEGVGDGVGLGKGVGLGGVGDGVGDGVGAGVGDGVGLGGAVQVQHVFLQGVMLGLPGSTLQVVDEATPLAVPQPAPHFEQVIWLQVNEVALVQHVGKLQAATDDPGHTAVELELLTPVKYWMLL